MENKMEEIYPEQSEPKIIEDNYSETQEEPRSYLSPDQRRALSLGYTALLK